MKALAVLVACCALAAATPSFAFGQIGFARPVGPHVAMSPGGRGWQDHGHHDDHHDGHPDDHHDHDHDHGNGLQYLNGALGPSELPPLPTPDAEAEPATAPVVDLPPIYRCPAFEAAPPRRVGPHIIYIGHQPKITGPKVIYGTD